MRRARLTAGVFFLLSGLGALGTARAEQPSQYTKDEALQLFNQARGLMVERKFVDACPMLEKAQAIDPGMGTLFNLSHCYEQIGRIASAWAGFRDVAVAAGAAGQAEREQVARERAAALEPRLSKLRISVPEDAMIPGLVVERDGVVVSTLIWGTDVPVDPGIHLVSATAPGKRPWSTKIDVTDPGKVVVLRVPLLAGAQATPPPGGSVAPPDEGRSAIPAVLLGLAAAGGLGAGAALLVTAGNKGDEAGALRAEIGTNGGKDNTCLASPAPPKCAELDSATRDQAAFKGIALGSFALGGVAAAGLLLYVLWPSPEGGASQALRGGPIRVGFSAGRSGTGIHVAGSF